MSGAQGLPTVHKELEDYFDWSSDQVHVRAVIIRLVRSEDLKFLNPLTLSEFATTNSFDALLESYQPVIL